MAWRPWSPHGLAAVVVTASIFLPDPAPRVHRIPGLDIDRVRWAECEYRGIASSFETLSRAYALKTYGDVELVGWEAWPSPHDPDTEALVACRFRVGGVKPDSMATDSTLALRRAAGRDLEVVWRLNTLYRISIAEYNDYARDALNVFTRTVNDLHDRLAVVGDPSRLRRGPGESYPAVGALEAGTIVLRDRQTGEWTSVEVRGDTLSGWLETEHLTIP